MGTHNQIKAIQTHKIQTYIKHTRPNWAVWTGPGSCSHGKRNFRCTA